MERVAKPIPFMGGLRPESPAVIRLGATKQGPERQGKI